MDQHWPAFGWAVRVLNDSHSSAAMASIVDVPLRKGGACVPADVTAKQPLASFAAHQALAAPITALEFGPGASTVHAGMFVAAHLRMRVLEC